MHPELLSCSYTRNDVGTDIISSWLGASTFLSKRLLLAVAGRILLSRRHGLSTDSLVQ